MAKMKKIPKVNQLSQGEIIDKRDLLRIVKPKMVRFSLIQQEKMAGGVLTLN